MTPHFDIIEFLRLGYGKGDGGALLTKRHGDGGGLMSMLGRRHILGKNKVFVLLGFNE